MLMTYFLMTFSLLVTSVYKKKSIIKNTFFFNCLNIASLVTSLTDAIYRKCYCSPSFKEMERIHLSEFINLCCKYCFLLDIVAFLILLMFVKFADEKCKYFQLLLYLVKYLVYAMILIVLLATLASSILFLVPLIILYVMNISPEYHSLFATCFFFVSFNFFVSTVIGVVVAVAARCKLNLCEEAQTNYKEMMFYRQYLICCNNKSCNSDINTEVMRLRGGSKVMKSSKDSDSKLRRKKKRKKSSSGSVSRSTSSVRSLGHKKTLKNDGVRLRAGVEQKSKHKTSTESVRLRRSRKRSPPLKKSSDASRRKTSESKSVCPCNPEELKKKKDPDADLEEEKDSDVDVDVDFKKIKEPDADLKEKEDTDADLKEKKEPEADLKEKKVLDADLKEKKDVAGLKKKKDPDADFKKKKEPDADHKKKKEPDADHKKKKGSLIETKKRRAPSIPCMKGESSDSGTKDKRGYDATSKAKKVTDASIKHERDASGSEKKPGRKKTPPSSGKSSSSESKTSSDSGRSESSSESSVDAIVKHTEVGPVDKMSTDKSPKYKMRTDKTIPKRKEGSDHVGKRSVGTWKKGSSKDKPKIIKFRGPNKPLGKISASDMIIAERPEILTSDLDKVPSKNKKLQAYIHEPNKLKQFPDESAAVLKKKNTEAESKKDQIVKVLCPVWSRKLLPKCGLWDPSVMIVQCPDCQGLVVDETQRKKDLLKAGRGLSICKCPPATPFMLPSESEFDEPKRGKKRWSSIFSRQTSKTKEKERKKEPPKGGHEGNGGLGGRGGKDGEALILYKSPRYPSDRSRVLLNYQDGQKQKEDGGVLRDIDSRDHLLDIQTDVVLRVNLPHKRNRVPDGHDQASGLACFFDPKMLPVSFDEPAQVVRCGKWRHGTFTETVSTRQTLDSGELVKSMRYTKSLFKSASRRNLTDACECSTQARPSDIGINVDVDIVSPIGRGIGKPVHMQLDNKLTKLKLPCDCDQCRSNMVKIGPSRAHELDYKLRHAPSRCSPM